MTVNLPNIFYSIERFLLPVATLVMVSLLLLIPGVISMTVQWVGLAIMVVILGLPHGALDPWIAEQAGLQNTLWHRIMFNVVYFLIAVSVVVAWILAPVFCLLVFLLISAWHFSADWSGQIPRPLQLLMGCLLLLMPISFHTEQVAVIFSHLSGDDGAQLAYSLALPQFMVTIAVIFLSLFALRAHHKEAAIDYASLLVLAAIAPPLIYFALYFCLLHSPRHLMGLMRSAGASQQGRLLWMLVIYTAVTLIPIGLLGWYWSALPTETLYLRLIFIGLAAVTVPHMLLIGWANFRRKEKA
jgi:Brp/Blh family beta-carotene 15,15'-monooxygenase